ncbi:RNA polymerase subunit sigma [Cryobacterium sp. LW097]|uniref:sigma-70 family RNA polymerase sigma factor n=1 Tax=unclassified Cryobacterium TaxID=2649013 RepID=UPI000B4CE38C|nr:MULTISPECIES: sigma-70 family RNA polymerase sigma factor [unclassified Cryobacterium]ASD24043.1 RNA polymerase subunit sigma [Cryobacterium sp. LW097]TFC51023.1 sigma-70 family RNA polymerase sigma factor [Cryobacterium sp. TMB3-1-2]TFC57567.1 sigma-70 family RNA polymerase sigma factor [Cryobacterium sp. TMB1-7]TFC74369.1 sigma-70 family RNA polymerase sigma factor [Cryobacterium sp. TMB3-15]TFC79882.1 sigma-70 family RNA polymerase sigma factor [Cryobacterium sp. TMB3-10]
MAEPHAELLRALHDAHGPALFRYVVRLTGDYGFAQDVVQETLLRAWTRPALLDRDDDAARAWLFTVARNLVIDDRRSARYAREIATDDLPERSSTDATEAILDRWLLTDALTALTPEHRTVLVSAYYLGQSIAEIALLQQVPEGTVKSRLHYALRAMRLALQERGVTE